MNSRYLRVVLSCLALVLACPLAADAQYRYDAGQPGAPGAGGYYPGGPGYYPPGYGGGFYPGAAGGYMYGQAAVLDAYANLGQSQEQARIMREQANQAKLETQKKTIDTMNYERANKYWYSDEMVDIQSKKIQAAMNNPPAVEITSGRSLNVLLPYLDKIMSTGKRGPTIPVDPQLVKQLNVSTGTDTGNAGMLKDVDVMLWPVAIEGPNQKKLDDMLKSATASAMKGPVQPTVLRNITKQTDVVEQEVRGKFLKDELDSGDYLDAKRFLERVRQATTALGQPQVAQVITGQLGPQGNTIDEVVYSMASKGLKFAAAQPGADPAYFAMHRAMVDYAMVADVPDTGFRVMNYGYGASKSK